MALYQNYPYTDLQTLNLDGVLRQVKTNKENIESTAQNLAQESAARVAADNNPQAQIDVLDPESYRDAVTLNARSIAGAVVCIGDSYLAGWTPDGSVTDWGTNLCSYLGKTMGTDFFKYAEGGAGFAYVGSDGHKFIDLLQNACTSGDFELDSVKAVIVAGGFNDHYETYDNINNAVSVFTAWAANNLPNAKIMIANVGYGDNYTQNDWVKVSTAYSIHNSDSVFLGDIQTVLRAADTMASDKRHPNEYGQRKIAQAIYSAILCGDYTGDEHAVQSLSFGSVGMIWWVKNHTFYLVCKQSGSVGITPDSDISGSADGTRVAKTVPFTLQRSTDDFYRLTLPCLLVSNSVYKQAQVNIMITASSIVLRPLLLNSAGNGWVNLNTITEITPPAFTLAIPFAYL